MIYYMDNVTHQKCRELLGNLESLVFTDYQLVYKFVKHCERDIETLHCGRLSADDSEHQVFASNNNNNNNNHICKAP